MTGTETLIELVHFTFILFLRPGEREETPVHTYSSSFRVPVRTRFVPSTLVGPVSDRHASVVYSEDVGT